MYVVLLEQLIYIRPSNYIGNCKRIKIYNNNNNNNNNNYNNNNNNECGVTYNFCA